jgi:hypothetical protein
MGLRAPPGTGTSSRHGREETVVVDLDVVVGVGWLTLWPFACGAGSVVVVAEATGATGVGAGVG